MTDDYWNYTVEAYGDCVTVKRNIDNTISRVYIEVDGYATRDWTEDEVDAGKPRGDVEYMSDEEPKFTEYGKGAFAELKFDVEAGVASFAGVNVDDWDKDGYNFPRWLRLLHPAVKMVENVPGIGYCEDPEADLGEQLQIGENTTINGL